MCLIVVVVVLCLLSLLPACTTTCTKCCHGSQAELGRSILFLFFFFLRDRRRCSLQQMHDNVDMLSRNCHKFSILEEGKRKRYRGRASYGFLTIEPLKYHFVSIKPKKKNMIEVPSVFRFEYNSITI